MKTDTRKKIIIEKDVKKIDFTSPEFQKGLEEVRAQIELTRSYKKVDLRKRDFGYNI